MFIFSVCRVVPPVLCYSLCLFPFVSISLSVVICLCLCLLSLLSLFVYLLVVFSGLVRSLAFFAFGMTALCFFLFGWLFAGSVSFSAAFFWFCFILAFVGIFFDAVIFRLHFALGFCCVVFILLLPSICMPLVFSFFALVRVDGYLGGLSFILSMAIVALLSLLHGFLPCFATIAR